MYPAGGGKVKGAKPQVSESTKFVSRAGEKLDVAIEKLGLEVQGVIAADLGSSTGGFVDCLLQRGAHKVYSVDTAYGELAWKLRNDPRVIVLERTNALHVSLPEPVGLVTVDCGWTRQEKILPIARSLLAKGGTIITLVKPHYEARDDERSKGAVIPEKLDSIIERVRQTVSDLALTLHTTVESPLIGERGGNREIFFHLSCERQG